MRNFKILGLALVAMLALSAVGPGAASADDLTAEAYSTTLTGEKDPGAAVDQFLTTAGTLTCDTPRYSATITGPTTTVTVTPNFTTPGHVEPHLAPCRTSGLPTVIDMKGCTYQLNVGAGTTGDLDLVCPAGVEVTVVVTPATSATARCTIHIKAQSDIEGTVTYSNTGAGTTRDITVDANLKGIDYAHTAGSGLGACTTGSATNGTLTAKAVIRGEVHGGSTHRGIFLS
jgi:hypothetical protein